MATLYDRDPTQILPCRMTSMSMESLKSGNLQVSQVLFKKESLPVHPTQRDLLQLAFIFYLDIAKPDKNDKDQWFLDFSSILQAFTEETPETTLKLKSIVHQRFEWKFFEFPENCTLQYHLTRVRSFFQTLHRIGIAFVEGNHRAVLAAKLLYGQKVNSTFPLKPVTKKIPDATNTNDKQAHQASDIMTRHKRDEEEQQFIVPHDSPLHYQGLDVRVLVPECGKEFPIHRVITARQLRNCRDWSNRIAVVRKYMIKAHWGSFMVDTI